MHDAIPIDGVDNPAPSVGICSDDTVCDEFAHNFIIGVEANLSLRSGNFHEEAFKPWVPMNIGNQMLKVNVNFPKDDGVCLREVREGNPFAFRDIHLLGKYLR